MEKTLYLHVHTGGALSELVMTNISIEWLPGNPDPPMHGVSALNVLKG